MKTSERRSLLFLLLVLLPAAAQAVPAAPPASPEAQRRYPLPTLHLVHLQAGGHTLRVWLMDTDGEREEGMMFLQSKDVAADEGMLFLFSSAQPLTFWMKNTRIPLDIAYLNSGLHITNIVHGKVMDETLLPSRGPAQFVLEVKAGTLQRLRIRPGMAVKVTTFNSPPTQVKQAKDR